MDHRRKKGNRLCLSKQLHLKLRAITFPGLTWNLFKDGSISYIKKRAKPLTRIFLAGIADIFIEHNPLLLLPKTTE